AAIESSGAADEHAARVRAFVADPDPAVAAAASAALVSGRWRAEATDRLRALLSDEDPDVRVATVRRIGVAPAPDVVELLRPMLDDGSASVRTQALRTLTASAPDAAIAPALDALFAADVA